MPRQASVAGLKARLASFLQMVEDGDEVVITRHGRPIALLTRPRATTPGPKLGTLRGKIQYSPGWNEPMTDEEFEEFSRGKL